MAIEKVIIQNFKKFKDPFEISRKLQVEIEY